MTEGNKTNTRDKYDFIGCFYPGKKGNLHATINLEELKKKRYLLEPVEGDGDLAFKMYLSKIGGLKGEQVRDLDNYDACVTFYKKKGEYGTFYTSSKDADGKCFLLSPAKPAEEGAEPKKFSYVLKKEKVPYVKPEGGEAPAVQAAPEAKPLREFP